MINKAYLPMHIFRQAQYDLRTGHSELVEECGMEVLAIKK